MQLSEIPHSNCSNCVYLYCNLVYLFCKNLLSAFVSDGAPWLPSSSRSNPGPPKNLWNGGFPDLQTVRTTSQTFQGWKQNLQRRTTVKIHRCSEKMRRPVWLMNTMEEKMQTIGWWDREPRKPTILERSLEVASWCILNTTSNVFLGKIIFC